MEEHRIEFIPFAYTVIADSEMGGYDILVPAMTSRKLDM